MLLTCLTWQTADAQATYMVQNRTNSIWLVRINYLDANGQVHVFQEPVGPWDNFYEINDAVEMTQVMIRTTGGTPVGSATEDTYHWQDCITMNQVYLDAAPIQFTKACVQWGNLGDIDGACMVLYGF